MKIHSGEIQNYKAIHHIAFESKGNSIIIKGKNGSGKSSILETLQIAFLGKKAVPEGAIRLGEESSIITWHLGNEREVRFTVTVTLSGDDYKVTLHSYFNGKKVKLENPAGFLKSLIIDTALDPQSFFVKSDKEQVQALYDICPGLKDQLDQIDAEYKIVQEERSALTREGQRLKVNIESLTFNPDAPSTEVDPSELMIELEKARLHNAEKLKIETDCTQINNKISAVINNISNNATMQQSINDDISRLQARLNSLIDAAEKLHQEKVTLEAHKTIADTALQNFVLLPTDHIDLQIKNVGETNRKVRENIQYRKLESDIEQKRKEFSEGLEKMKALDEKRVNLFKTVQMPIAGLSVGDGCLMYPDPNTGKPVRIKSLSTGQQWAIIIPILAHYLPAEDKGLRSMIIKNLNDLDKENQELMFEEARKAGVQLIMHQTMFESEETQCQIIIKD